MILAWKEHERDDDDDDADGNNNDDTDGFLMWYDAALSDNDINGQ